MSCLALPKEVGNGGSGIYYLVGVGGACGPSYSEFLEGI
jgi:hypothetical protein